MSLRFDATLKEIFSLNPHHFAGVFRLPETTQARSLNIDLSTISAATDVAFGFGEPLQEIVDLNFQSGPDATVAARLLLYNAAFHLRYNVPVRSLLILLRPKADHQDLTGKLAYVCGGKRVRFEYDVVRMWKQPVSPYLTSGLGLLPLATVCKLPPGRPMHEGLRQVVQEIDRRLIQEPDHAQAVRLMTAAFILTGLRVPKEQLAQIYDGVRVMHESTAYDVWAEESERRGEARGEARGKIRQSHRLLLKQGSKRLGAVDPQSQSALTAIEDLDRLERMAEAVLSVASWKELLATP
jgi:predicted transposase YdaD